MRVVYFIQGVDGGPIKIGTTGNVSERLSAMQTASPARLVVLGVLAGAEDLEKSLHTRFASIRLGGEWFSPARELLSLIETAQPPPTAARREVRFEGMTAAELATKLGVGVLQVGRWFRGERIPSHQRTRLRFVAAFGIDEAHRILGKLVEFVMSQRSAAQ